MITSQEINAMISMQQQQAGYMGGVPMSAPMSGASQYPPQFSYAPQRMSASHVGQAAAGGLMNSVGPGAGGLSSMAFGITGAAGIGAMGAGFLGLGAAATKTAAGTGLAGAFGALESNALLGGMARLNPLNSMLMGGMAGVTQAGGMSSLLTGAGIRAGLAGAFGTAGLLNPISVAAMAASAPLMAMHRGAQQYSQTSAMIGSYNQFANPFASTGRGFSENQMSSMVSGMRTIQEASPFISMKDMQQTMTRFNEMGMNQGERDAEEFSRKFKSMAKTVTAMSKALGTTMDEASKVFGQMRGAGFYTGSDVMQNTVLAGTMRGQGISGSTMIGAQTVGGGISRAGGLGTTPGAKAVGGVMSMLTGARGAGALSNEEMMNITGASTPDQAIAQLSTTMAGSLTGFYTQTGVGQSMLAALGQTNDRGEFTGGLDAEAIEGLRSGKIDINNLVSKGRGKVSTRNAALSFKTKGQDVAGALLSEGDPTAAIGAIMQSVAGDKFKEMDPENLVTLLTERIQGLGRKEAEAMTKLYREGEKIRRESQQQIRQEVQSEIFATDIRENHSIGGITRKVLGGISDDFSPLGELGQRISVGAGGVAQNIGDAIAGGVVRVGSTAELRQRSMDAFVGTPGSAGISGGVGPVGLKDAVLNEKLLAGTLRSSDITLTERGQELATFLSGKTGDIDEFAPADRLAPAVVGAGLRDGKTVQEYLLNIQVGTKGGGHTKRARRVKDVLKEGGQEAEDLKQALAVVALQKNSSYAAQGVASLGEEGTTADTLEARTQAIKGIIGEGFRGGGFSTDQQDYEGLMSGRNLAVATAIGGRMGVDELKNVYDTALGQGQDPMEALKKRGVTGLSSSDVQGFVKWAESTNNLSLSKDELQKVSDLSFGAQQVMDLSNLASMARASADVAGTDTVGADKMRELARQAGMGGVESTRTAIEGLLDELETNNLTAGDLSTENYGALTGGLGRALSQRRQVDASTSDEERKKILGSFGLSDEALSRVNLSDKEAVKELIGRAAVQGDAISSGGAFTDTTQAEAAKYYAETFSKVNYEILRIQANNAQMESQIAAVAAKVER